MGSSIYIFTGLYRDPEAMALESGGTGQVDERPVCSSHLLTFGLRPQVSLSGALLVTLKFRGLIRVCGATVSGGRGYWRG